MMAAPCCLSQVCVVCGILLLLCLEVLYIVVGKPTLSRLFVALRGEIKVYTFLASCRLYPEVPLVTAKVCQDVA